MPPDSTWIEAPPRWRNMHTSSLHAAPHPPHVPVSVEPASNAPHRHPVPGSRPLDSSGNRHLALALPYGVRMASEPYPNTTDRRHSRSHESASPHSHPSPASQMPPQFAPTACPRPDSQHHHDPERHARHGSDAPLSLQIPTEQGKSILLFWRRRNVVAVNLTNVTLPHNPNH